MPAIDIVLEGDGAWPDLAEAREQGRLTWLRDVPGEPSGRLAIAVLGGGMASGLPSIAIRMDLPDGRVVVAESSMRLFLVAADVFRARYGGGLA